ncbi:MAG: hypothetical protein Q7U32_09540 [Rhodocyclaceae bacterium]|nr:hypothetical protein [Rhodocyclaceae bacterium]MDO9600934.1 hypothetical protein [Rhodocyclaceae bacterium]MDP2195751.1 hypothetical protein [Rhodocyclaceae bacterium]
MAFPRFLRSAAARTAQLLNIADMARDVGVAPNTAKHWLSILQASGLIWLLISRNVAARPRWRRCGIFRYWKILDSKQVPEPSPA